jgi:hypothetical protein
LKLETEEEINEEDLNQAKVEIDEEKETIKITLPNNKTIEGRILKPIARRIVMLGRKRWKANAFIRAYLFKIWSGR